MLWWTLQQLKSSNWETRAAAAAQLQASNQHKGVPALIKALDDENAQVRLAVINALAALAHPAAAEPLATALSGLSQRAKSARAGSENAEYEAMAVALGRLDGAAVPPLMHLLDSAEREVRRWAAHALGLTRDPRAVDPLVSLLSDSRSETRKAAALALGAIGNVIAVDPLMKALGNRDPETRRAAALALGTIGSEKAVEALRAVSEDSNEPVQLAVVEALRSIGGLRAAAALRSVIDSARKNVREAASTALDAIEFAPATAEDRAEVAVLRGDFRSAAREGAAAVGALSEALGSKDDGRRRQAAETLALLHTPGAVEPLLQALRDYHPAVQAAAVRALVSVGTEALDALTQSLSHHDPTVQRLAAAALGAIGNSRSVGALAGIIEQNRIISNEYLDLVEGVRAAAEALGAILAKNAAAIDISDLQRIADLPDPQLQGAIRIAGEAAVDCETVRNCARQEIQRRNF